MQYKNTIVEFALVYAARWANKYRLPAFYTLLLCAILFIPFTAYTRQPEGLVAKYSFNNGDAKSEVGPDDVKVFGATITDDRFGNKNSAYYLQGTPGSYLDLGTSPVLKPAAATISIWIRLEDMTYAGKGYDANPIIGTRTHLGDDFNEAYSITVGFASKRLSAASYEVKGQDTAQAVVRSIAGIKPARWYHLALCYNDTMLCLYVNGVLQNTASKNYRTKFLPTDSVMVGFTDDGRNLRWFNGTIDDIEFYNRVLGPAEITMLYNAPDPNRFRVFFKWAGIVFLFAGGITALILLIIRRYKKALKKEKERNKMQKHIYEMEMHILKVQMNPHFIFNVLNALKSLVRQGKAVNAEAYLDKFSALLRKTLESNTNDYIPLQVEIDMLSKYIELEALRFDKAFTYEISVDTALISSTPQILQMLIQPIVENAILHGLLPKQGNKNLNISFSYVNSKALSCTIDDNGIGRNGQCKPVLHMKEKSLAIRFISQRLQLMQKELGEAYGIDIYDKRDDRGESLGTRVTITMPLINYEPTESSNY